MLKLYYFNKNANNRHHEVHVQRCPHSPFSRNRELIGYFRTCKEAIKKARKMNPMLKYDGCKYCCKSCHKV